MQTEGKLFFADEVGRLTEQRLPCIHANAANLADENRERADKFRAQRELSPAADIVEEIGKRGELALGHRRMTVHPGFKHAERNAQAAGELLPADQIRCLTKQGLPCIHASGVQAGAHVKKRSVALIGTLLCGNVRLIR